MADFLDSEAEESGLESEDEADQPERKKAKRKAVESDDEDDDEDDEEKLREELKDLIDDAPLEESGSEGEDSDGSRGGRGRDKRKQSDDELDDRLEEDDYDLIEENLGVKVERKKFKRVRRIQDDESDGEEAAHQRDAIHDQLFVAGSDDEEERRSSGGVSQAPAPEAPEFDEDEDEGESDADDFIVDDDGRPIAEKKKKRKPIFTDVTLQEGQDIFGVDFDYDEFEKYEEDEYEDDEDEDEYLEEDDDDGEARARKTKKAKNRRPTKKSIFEIYEPSELKRGHFTDLDNEIRNTDIPERMQVREVPLSTPVEGELDDEAEWIYRQAFARAPLSGGGTRHRKAQFSSAAIPKIKQALDFMRNQTLEVPFIAFYRKEYVQPDLDIDALWKVYKYDAKWCLLRQRKANLLALMERMRNYQLDQVMLKPDEPLPETMRLLKDSDIDRLKATQTSEELADVHAHFLLHYAHDIPAMQAAHRLMVKQQKKAEKRAERLRQAAENAEAEDGEDLIDIDKAIEEDDDHEEESAPVLKHAARSGPYHMCRKAGLEKLVKKFGLTPAQYSENVHNNYQKHEVLQETGTPLEAASRWITESGSANGGWSGRPQEVLKGATLMMGVQLAREPQLRVALREALRERATFSVHATHKGIVEIDENHPCYTMKYLKNKPIRDLTGDQYLKLVLAQDDKLITLSLAEEPTGPTGEKVINEMKQLFNKDEFAASVQAWNEVRGEAVEMALMKVLLPELRRELHAALLEEAKEKVVAACRRRLHDILRVAPYKPASSMTEDDDEWDASRGTRIFGLSYSTDRDEAAFGAVIGPGGDVIDHLRLPAPLERQSRDERIAALTRFISSKKPHVVIIAGESREALGLKGDVQEAIARLVDDENFPRIPIEIQDNHFAKVYANSAKGESDFREYPLILRQAISQARLLQDPLIELSCLCGPDDEILCLRWNSLQDQITREELLAAIQVEFINRTNEVGIDVNAAVQNNRGTELLQFVCGLGARKGQALLKLLKQTNQRLENRTQLVTACHMGPKVFINCSGFIKIDTTSLGDSTEAYVEVLDGSRVHPETYEWARKMAVDALEYEEEDANPAGALEEILESPERLKDLDLDAFAEELERQGFGNKSITLYDIRAELNCRYRDLRTPYRSPSHEELFDILTKEMPDTFYIGKLILARVIGITHRKPQRDQLDQANPVKDRETGLWQCPFCLNNEFPELSEVWNHFDAGACPGQATGVRLRLENGLSGYIHVKNLSDRHVTNPAERVKIGQTIHCRVLKIDAERFSVDCSSKTSDLTDASHEWRPTRDPYYDRDAEEKDKRKTADAKMTARRRQYVKRVIVHPAFRNISFAEAEKEMALMDQGEGLVRPSSKGADHLTVTWKVADGIYQHVDVREEGKENDFSLGRSLWIGGDEFEDLDEIIARYVTPMAGHARDLLHFKYYRPLGGIRDKAEELLREEKRKNANKIHYFLSAAKNYPGRFLLSYLPSSRCRHEYVSVSPDGFRFRQRNFDSLGSMLRWFKEHFREPPPAVRTAPPPSMSAAYRTPIVSHTPGHRTPALVQAPHTYMNTPYTPSAQTPYMTPYAMTPRQHSQTAMPPPTHIPHHIHHSHHQSRPAAAATYPSDPTAWQKAAEAWAKLKTREISTPGTPMSPSPSTPRSNVSRTPRYEEPRRTPQYSSGRQSARSTPHTNTSPRSMSLGDATPLYDEN